MMPVVFINCSRFPFIDWILTGEKTYETRTRNTLRSLVGTRVLLAETGKGKPVVRCSAVIRSAEKAEYLGVWNLLREFHRVPEKSVYDWSFSRPGKWLYLLEEVRPVPVPFHPTEGVRHGRVWMETESLEVI